MRVELDSNALGQMLRERRKALGLSQDDVAMTAGVARRVIGELERGKPSVQLQIVLDVAAALGLNVDLTPREGARRA